MAKDESFVSPVVKWLLFSFNMLFWIVGWGLIAIGAYAYLETEKYSPQEVKSILDVIFNASLAFIVFGCLVFILAFMGAIGALRENVCLLTTFAILLGIIFLLEVIAAIVVFAFWDRVKTNLEEVLQEQAIQEYRESLNTQNIVDWFQETFECCGATTDGYKDWLTNKYFNCSSKGFEACSVPYSCCKNPYTFDSEVIDTRCGADILGKSRSEASATIYTTGCVDASVNSAKSNIFIVGGVALGIVIPQIIGIFLARALIGQVNDQKAKWRR